VREHPDVLVQTHIAENRREIEWTAELFPERKNYLDIYDHHGLIGKRAVLAHACTFPRRAMPLPQSGTAAFPLPDLQPVSRAPASFTSAPRRMRGVPYRSGSVPTSAAAPALAACHDGRGFTNCAAQRHALTAIEAFYLATLGARARSRFEDRIGSIAPGKEADLVVLDRRRRRCSTCAMRVRNRWKIFCSRYE